VAPPANRTPDVDQLAAWINTAPVMKLIQLLDRLNPKLAGEFAEATQLDPDTALSAAEAALRRPDVRRGQGSEFEQFAREVEDVRIRVAARRALTRE
jgi:hypothetical protein